ncbi:MAG: hypothetical protein PWR24_265 [Desulfonauticus sp.]|jgi:hypothetical protein|nr:MAG: hypothetical protein XD41_0384 [Desulfonauticus sp. 38_4375]MDK2920708.1 hypothetical protein [Desulfonauticus sp.]
MFRTYLKWWLVVALFSGMVFYSTLTMSNYLALSVVF